MNRRNLVIAAAVALLGIVAAVAVSFLHDGLSARAKPTALEAMVARKARHMAIPSSARLTQNPVLASAEDMRDARLHFADHCAICHANDGSGQTMIGNGLYPKPPDLRLQTTQNPVMASFSGSLRMACDLRECRVFQWRRAWRQRGQLEAGSLYIRIFPI